MTPQAILYLGFFAITLSLGWLAGRQIKSEADFHVAGRRMTWPVLTGSFLAANVSIGLFLGGTNMAGNIGYAFWCAYFTTSIGFLIAIGFVGVLVRRLAGRYKIYSFADFLATRYSSRKVAIRCAVGALMSLMFIPYMAAQLTGLAAITVSVFNLPYALVLIVTSLFVIGYTLWGGMVGVVWTDTFMCLVLFLGMILAVPTGIAYVGDGSAEVGWQRLLEQLPPEIFTGVQPHWSWMALAGQLIWIFAVPSGPHLVTRFLTARDEQTVLKSLPLCVALGLFVYGSTVPTGLLGRLVAGPMGAQEYYYFALAERGLGAWIGGFALAGIAAAALSTCSTEMIITSQTLSRDLYSVYLRPHASNREIVLISRLSLLVVGLVTLLVAWYAGVGVFWLVFSSASLLASGFFVPIVGGLFSRRGSGTAAALSMISGFAACIGAYLANSYGLMALSSLEGFIGLGVSLLVYLLVSWISPPTAEELALVADLASN
ncbi:MAG: sodium:solute symporter family protein [Acidobacteria bacterium]|nr:sodium:solute symporter family protein [Acidobacteriota bacterium]